MKSNNEGGTLGLVLSILMWLAVMVLLSTLLMMFVRYLLSDIDKRLNNDIPPAVAENMGGVQRVLDGSEWAYRWQQVELHNMERQRVGVCPLIPSEELNTRTQARAERMAYGLEEFNHDGFNEAVYGIHGVVYRWMGENIGRSNYPDAPGSLVAAFMESEGHRGNIIRPEWDEIGVGVSNRDGMWYVVVWFADTGVQCGDTVEIGVE